MVNQYNDFSVLKDDWNRLYALNSKYIFQSFDYNLINWGFLSCNNSLFIIAYHDGNNTVRAILPTYVDSHKVLRFIRDSGTDMCDMIYDPSINLIDVMKEISTFCMSQKNIRCISLSNLTYDSPLLAYLKIFIKKSVVYSCNEYSYLQCKKSDDPYSEFIHLSGERRKKLKKIVKQTESMPFKIYKKSSGDEYPISALESIAGIMTAKGIRPKSYFNKDFWEYTKKCFECGLMEVAVLFNTDGSPLSSGFVFVNDMISVRWVIMYTDPKYNLWNNVRYIDIKARQCSYENNFGRGGYDYKIGNFKPIVALLYKILIPVNLSGKVYASKQISVYLLKRILGDSKIFELLRSVKVKLLNII